MTEPMTQTQCDAAADAAHTEYLVDQIVQRLITISLRDEVPVMELAVMGARRRPSFTFMAVARDFGVRPTADLHAAVVDELRTEVATDPTFIA